MISICDSRESFIVNHILTNPEQEQQQHRPDCQQM